MLIKQRRIRNLNFLSCYKESNEITIGIQISNIKNRIDDIGLSGLEEGISILPPIIGPISKFNAEGKNESQKNMPLETIYREQYRNLPQRAGRGKVERVGRYVDVPYKRYPIKYIDPIGIEIYKQNDWVYITSNFTLGIDDFLVKHTINLFLELFGECEILGGEKKPLIKTSGLKRFNWEFVKPGTTWIEVKKEISERILHKTDNQKKVINERLLFAEKIGLVVVGYGIYGFRGYLALQNQKKNYTIFENINIGNAIYITDMNWEEFSQKDKQTILSSNLHKDRIIHNKGRQDQLRKYI